jgi:16S rRNA (cytosine967-C5)-methyltransferase
MVLRTNTLKGDRARLIKLLEKEGVTGRPTRYSPEGLEIEHLKGPITKLRAFESGLFQVQGEAAQVCSHLLFPKHGEKILDLCAGLGGKTTHLAALTGDKSTIIALDRARSRLIRLAENVRRLGIRSARSLNGDARGPLDWLFRCRFDKILIDAPCSGLGIISKHPDVKWRRKESDVKRLSSLQKEILNAAVPILTEGGRMLYVNCTISREENETVVRDFLDEHRNMAIEDLRVYASMWGVDLINEEGFLKTSPHVHGMEGFFGASFTKIDK